MKSKQCTVCKNTKTIDYFHKTKIGKYGVKSVCKKCVSKWNKEYYQRPEIKLKIRRYQQRPEVRRKRNIRKREYKMLKVYNITQSEFDEIIINQHGKCAICQKQLIKACIDHCHKTSKVRGILCRNCNLGLGLLEDNVEILQSAIKYLNNNS